MSFKTKIRKKSPCDIRVTLDAKHKEKVQYFEDLQKSYPDKIKKLKLLESKLNDYKLKNNKDLNDEEFEKKISLEEDIIELKKEIKEIEKQKEDVDYLLDTGHLLFNYYNNTNEIAEGKINSVNDIKKKKKNKTKGKSVMDYFQQGKINVSNSNKDNDCDEYHKQNKAEDKQENKYLSRAKIYDRYLSKTDENYILQNIDETNIDICKRCNVEKIVYLSEGKQICPVCSEENFILIDSDKPSYKDPPREVSYFAYKRINHFNEWLAQFQAKESTDIPEDVYKKILVELKKERIDNMCDLSPQKLREILKKLKKNKYYEHVPHIINKLNGQPPPIMTRETEEELRRMFKEIQIPFHKFCPKARKNFLSYSYVLHKFVQLLELDQFLPCFMLLKSREKLHQQDQIWKKICEHLRWEFIPSV